MHIDVYCQKHSLGSIVHSSDSLYLHKLQFCRYGGTVPRFTYHDVLIGNQQVLSGSSAREPIETEQPWP